MKIRSLIYLVLLIILFSCNQDKEDYEMLPIYSGKEIFISESNETKVFPVIDDYISIRKDHSVEPKTKNIN